MPLPQHVADSEFRKVVSEARRVWAGTRTVGAASSEGSTIDNSPRDTSELSFDIGAGACTLTLPRIAPEQFCGWLGQRLVWWPGSVFTGQRISIVSSRLKEQGDQRQLWFDALRTAVLRCDRETECLCVVDKTTAADAVRRAAALFQMPLLRLVIDESTCCDISALENWLKAVSSINNFEGPVAYISPELVPDSTTQQASVPARDRLLTVAAERAVALSCRTGGNVHDLLHRRLRESSRATVLVHATRSLTPAQTIDDLVSAGAVNWILERRCENAGSTLSVDGVESDLQPPVFPDGPLSRPGEWLCHWTRPRRGPWPGESRDDDLDQWILGCESADYSAFAALVRIVESQTLHTSQMSRGCISFTAVPLAEFRHRRVYRKHLRRFDFEPWGVAVRKSVLRNFGARPVQYLENCDDQSDRGWDEHPRHDKSGRTDWSLECEWRIPGRLGLDQLPGAAIVLFVDSPQEAKMLRKISPWTVIELPQPESESLTEGNRIS